MENLTVYNNETIMESMDMFFADADTNNMEIFITDKKKKQKSKTDDDYLIGLGNASNFEYEWLDNDEDKLILHIRYNDLDDGKNKELNINIFNFVDYINLGLSEDKLDIGAYVLDRF